MIARDAIQTGIVNRADALKRVRVPKTDADNDKKVFSFTIESVVREILDSIEVINSLPEFSEMLWGKRLSEITIANEWKDFILPEAVRFDPTDLKTNNLLIKPEATISHEVADYNKFLENQMKFRGLFKKDLSTDTTTLDQLFVTKSLYDILPIAAMWETSNTKTSKASVPVSVRSIDEPFIPVRIKHEIKCLFRSDYLNSTVDQMIQDYMAKVKF